ncbi:MAG: hypothetical protein M0R32_09840 [Candidatus Cloacimonetes bacterium]|jgi:hypothetical protein|nr:hypothetical protein [Candidatus Cloacimonadota bacterium]
MSARKDYTGQRFGKLTVVKLSVESPNSKKRKWECLCDCGKAFICYEYRLLRKNRKNQASCGCSLIRDYTGRRFGILTVIGRTTEADKYGLLWELRCDCGKKIKKAYDKFKFRTSCGCETFPFGNKSKTWNGYGQISRSYFSHIKGHAKTRGIEFDISIEYLWSLYEKQNGRCSLSGAELIPPVSRHKIKTASLDRIDSNKGYIESNVRWIHKDLNLLRWDYPDEIFINFCRLVSSNNSKSKRLDFKEARWDRRAKPSKY